MWKWWIYASIYILCEADQWAVTKSLRTDPSHLKRFILRSVYIEDTFEMASKEFTAVEVAAAVLESSNKDNEALNKPRKCP